MYKRKLKKKVAVCCSNTHKMVETDSNGYNSSLSQIFVNMNFKESIRSMKKTIHSFLEMHSFS